MRSLCLLHTGMRSSTQTCQILKMEGIQCKRILLCRLHYTGPSLADAGPGARYGAGPPSVRLQWRYGGGGGGFDSVRHGGGGSIPFVAGRGARCDRTSCTAQRTALAT